MLSGDETSEVQLLNKRMTDTAAIETHPLLN